MSILMILKGLLGPIPGLEDTWTIENTKKSQKQPGVLVRIVKNTIGF